MGRIISPQKIQNKESNYYDIDCLSYSRLALFAKDRLKYYKKYIALEEETEESKYMLMGSIVDTLLTEGQESFDKKYVIASAEEPAPQMKQFITFLVKNYPNFEQFTACLEKSYNELLEWNGGKLGTGFDKYIENFNKLGKDYFTEQLNAVGKTLINLEEATIAQEIVNKINNCEAFKCKGNKVLMQQEIFFELDGEQFKCKFDGIDVCDKTKTFFPWDLKITSFVEDFIYKCYLGNYYYIQSSLYRFALEKFIEENEEYKGYKIENFEFRVADQTNRLKPLCYKLQDGHYEQGFQGFYVNNKYYKGIMQILEELSFAVKNSEFGISQYNYNNNSVVHIPKFEDTMS